MRGSNKLNAGAEGNLVRIDHNDAGTHDDEYFICSCTYSFTDWVRVTGDGWEEVQYDESSQIIPMEITALRFDYWKEKATAGPTQCDWIEGLESDEITEYVKLDNYAALGMIHWPDAFASQDAISAMKVQMDKLRDICYACGEVEEETSDEFELKAWIEDEDNFITPADEFRLELEFVNREKLPTNIFQIHLEIDPQSVSSTVENAMYYVRETNQPFLKYTLSPDPGLWLRETHETEFVLKIEEQVLSDRIGYYMRTEAENNAWIFEHLVGPRKHGTNGSVLLNTKVNAKLVAEDGSVIYEELLDIQLGDKAAKIQYPMDLNAQAAFAESSQLSYALNGDAGTHAVTPEMAYLALRAARYDKAAYDKLGKGLLDVKPIPEDWFYPETTEEVVRNIADYVYDALQPKIKTDIPLLSNEIGELLLKGSIGPGKSFAGDLMNIAFNTGGKDGIGSMEHAYLFNNFLRLVGIPVREVNVIQLPFALSSKILGWMRDDDGSFIRDQIDETVYFQDAASEVWMPTSSGGYDWQFYSLFNDDGPMTDPIQRYGSYTSVFEMWAGVKAQSKFDKYRFQMTSDDMSESDLWEFRGYGSKGPMGEQVTYSTEDRGDGWLDENFSFLVYRLFSPVTADVEIDGETYGNSTMKGKEKKLFEAIQSTGSSDLFKTLNPESGVYYYPQGLPMIQFAEDGDEEMHESIVVIVENDDVENVDLVLTAFEDGEYTLKSFRLSNEAVTVFEDETQSVEKKDDFVYAFGELEEAETIEISEKEESDNGDAERGKKMRQEIKGIPVVYLGAGVVLLALLMIFFGVRLWKRR